MRWVIALLVVALVLAGGISAALLLTGSAPAATVLGYAPADTILYAEARLDLPGSQRAEVAKTLSAFPGFADQAALNQKLGEVLDRVVKGATGGKHDYQTEIAPWFGGQLAVAQGPVDSLAGMLGGAAGSASATPAPTAALPPCTGGDLPSAAPGASGGAITGAAIASRVQALLLASVTDPAKADAWVSSVLAEAGGTVSTVTCDGVTVHVAAGPAGSPIGTVSAGWAVIDGKVLAVGDLDSIRSAIATKGVSGLSTNPAFQKAADALPGDHLAFMWADVKSALGSTLSSASSVDLTGAASSALDLLGGLVPDWTAASLEASGGNLVVETVQPATTAVPATNRPSALIDVAPATTIALIDVHDLGKTLTAAHDKAAGDPKLKGYVDQLDAALGLVGGFGATLGWIGDAGVAVTHDGTGVSGGLLISPDDAAAAKRLFDQLRSFAQLAGLGTGGAVSDETYNGATITTVDLSSLAPLIQQGLAGSGAASGVTIPKDLKLVYTVTDKVVVITIDPAFAKAAIDASQGGASLAKDPRFSALLSASGGDVGTGLSWLDVTAIRGIVEAALPADSRAAYEANLKPYLLPIDALLSTGKVDAGLQRGTMTLSIKH